MAEEAGKALIDGIVANDIVAMVRAVEAGASVTAPVNEHGSPPLQLAVGHGNMEAMQWLVERGADVNAADDTGNTTLDSAVANGNIAALKWLTEHGAGDVYTIHCTQYTPTACRYCIHCALYSLYTMHCTHYILCTVLTIYCALYSCMEQVSGLQV
jgi:hypothetical protein